MGHPPSETVEEALQLASVEIAASRNLLILRWADRHVSRYPFWYVRGYCPCAVCQGHGGGWSFVARPQAPLQDVAEVGHYALNLVWDDGHRTGIYPFELLRRLCPCPDCRRTLGDVHPWARLPRTGP